MPLISIFFITFVPLNANVMVMIKKILSLMMALVGLQTLSDKAFAGGNVYPGGKSYMYRLYLTDKNHTEYTIDHPEAFLSKKAIERRRKQQIAIDETDLPLPDTYLRQITIMGGQVVGKSKWNNTVLIRVAERATAEHMTDLPFVSRVLKVWESPDTLVHNRRDNIQKTLGEKEHHVGSYYGAAELQITMLNGQVLHGAGYKGKGMTIAVLDGGFTNVNRIPALAKIKVIGTRNFVATLSDDVYAEHDHGTRVLSCMGASEPEYIVGTAPEATYWLIRAEDVYTETLAEEDYWAAAVEFADSVGADVVNSSLGYQDFDGNEGDHIYRELDGHTALISCTASMMADKGMVLCNSAGNDGMGTWKKINFPADADNILTVGAVNSMRKNAAFSSIGPSADGRVKPDVMSLGSPAAVISGRGAISFDMGTSFASPIMAGMVACLWQARPELTARQLIQLVRESSHQYDYPDNIFGYGIPDFEKAMKSDR